MNLADEKIIALIIPLIPKERMAEAAVYLDTKLRTKGEIVAIGRKEHPMPFTGYFVFVDFIPMANWGHPALGVLVNQNGENVQAIETEFPPFFGDPPDTYRKLSLGIT